MKPLLLLAAFCLSSSLPAQTISHMNDLNPEEKAAAVQLKLNGKLTVDGNSDFRQMRDLCYQLKKVDLSGADCPTIPDNAFHSRSRLEQVLFPDRLKSIGTQAFYACRSLTALTLPPSVARVGDAAFSCCDRLEEVVFEGTPVLGEFAFAHARALKRVIVKSDVPPAAAPTAFYGLNRKKVKLTVPRGSEWRYRKAVGWKNFFSDPVPSKQLCDVSHVLIPQPATLQVHDHSAPFQLNRKWRIEAADGLDNEKEQAARIISARLGKLKEPENSEKARLRLLFDEHLADDEAYTLDVTAHEITIHGRTAAGVFYGLMTLDQLMRGDGSSIRCSALPQLHIADAPRTHIREFMVDPCRTFIPFDELKAFVPEMARYKMNALHLHLVDDQAWRIEIKKYPELTEKASSRIGMDDMQVPISGFYTQKQMRELVEYATTYHVQVIPEIEMPGHEVAAIHVYPALTCHAKQVPLRTTCGVSNELLCAGNEFTYEFLGNVFREITDIFPSPYIHLGGDEAGNPPLDCWTSCPECQKLKKRLGITTTDRSENWRLQEYLFNRVIDTLRTQYHKTPMFWYETDFKRIQPGCVTFAWRSGLTRAALNAAVENKARIMLCPGEHCYFDYPMAKGDMPEVNWGMPVTSLKSTYALDPSWGMGEEFEKNNLFGVAGTLWSECINSPERIYYQAYPRGLALAEAGWSQASVRSWEGFLKRLKPTLKDMMRRGITFSMKY